MRCQSVVALCAFLVRADGFLAPKLLHPVSTATCEHYYSDTTSALCAESTDDDIFDDEVPPEPIAVSINTTLTDVKVKKLFAWIKQAFMYDESDKNDVYAYYYNNIELAIAASFGENLPKDSLPTKLMDMALKGEEGLTVDADQNDIISTKEWEELLVGDRIGRRSREDASLGAMGAGQWTGRWMTRPHCECISTCMRYIIFHAPNR